MDLDGIRSLIADDLNATDQLIIDRLASDVVLINQVGHYIVGSGGKRLRPVIVLLAARALGYQGTDHVDMAAIVEFIHTATLLHDDVVDGSEQRRSRDTANAVWGNAASVLVGDFLYSRSFEMMVSVDNMRVMEVLSTATNRIAEGEVLQLLNCNDPDTDEARYREVILRKTATLFEAGARLGGVISEATAAEEQALADYGRHLGMAFQMIDDALDYGSSGEDIGKNIGDDLAEGKPTLPLIHTIRNGSPEQAKLIKDAIRTGGLDRLQDIIHIVRDSGGLSHTVAVAEQQTRLALAALETVPESRYKEALQTLALESLKRTH